MSTSYYYYDADGTHCSVPPTSVTCDSDGRYHDDDGHECYSDDGDHHDDIRVADQHYKTATSRFEAA